MLGILLHLQEAEFIGLDILTDILDICIYLKKVKSEPPSPLYSPLWCLQCIYAYTPPGQKGNNYNFN